MEHLIQALCSRNFFGQFGQRPSSSCNSDEKKYDKKAAVCTTQPTTQLESTTLTVQLGRIERELYLIYKQYCTTDHLKKKLLFNSFLKKSEELTQLQTENNCEKVKLLKNIVKNINDPKSLKAAKKFYTNLDDYNKRFDDKVKENDDWVYFDSENNDDQSMEFMQNTMDRFGLKLMLELPPDKEEENNNNYNDDCENNNNNSDNMPPLPNEVVLVPALKTDNTCSYKSVTFNDSAHTDDDTEDDDTKDFNDVEI